MATYTWIGTTSDWSTPTNWSVSPATGTVPGAADDVIISNAAPCTVTADSLCFNINFTGYTSTFTITSGFTLSVRGTTITMSSSGMTFATGTTGVLSTAAGNQGAVAIAFNGVTIPRLTIGKSSTPNLQTITVSGASPTVQHLTTSSAQPTQVTLAGVNLIVTTSLSILGTTSLTGLPPTITGTCTFNTAGNISGGFNVTAGSTVILANTLRVGGGTVTFAVGSFLTDVSFGISVNFSTSVLNTAPVTWYSFTQTATGTTFITSDLNIGAGGINVGALGTFILNGAFAVNVSGSVVAPTINLLSNATLNLTGSGNITITGISSGTVNIATGATYAITGTTLSLNGCIFRLVGTATCSVPVTHTLTLTSATLTTNNTATGANVVGGSEIQWKNVSIVFTNTITYTTTVLGNLAGANATTVINTGKMLVYGNLSIIAGASFTGTSTIEFVGGVASTWGTGTYRNNVIVNKSGGVTVTVTGAATWGLAGNTLNIITGNNLVLSAALSVGGGTVLVPSGSIVSGSANLIMAGTSTLDVATGITIPNLAAQNTITVTLARTTVATNYSKLGGLAVTFSAASAAELRVNNILVGSSNTVMGTNTTFRLMGGTFVTFNFSGACVLDTGATITGTGAGGSGFVANGTASLNLSAGTLVLPVISGSYTTGTGITSSQGPFTLNMGTNEIDYFSASSGGLGNGRFILQSDLKINKVFVGFGFGTGVTDNGFNIIVKESVYWKNGGFVSTGKIIYKGVPPGTGFVGTGYISGTTLTILSVTSGTLIPGQYIHCPADSTAAANRITVINTFGTTYTVATSQTVGSALAPVVFYGDGANADLGSPYSSPSSPRGILEIDADSNDVYYFGGQFNSANSELRYLNTNTGAFDGSKAVVSLIITGSVGTIDFQGQSSPTKYIGTMLISNFFGAFILKSDLYVNDHQGNPGLATYLQNSGGTYSLYVMRNFSVGNGTAVPYIMQPTIRLVGPLPCTFTCTYFMGNLVIAKDAGAVVTVTQSFVYGYATPTTITYTSGIVNFGATTLSLTGSVSIINPASVGLFSFNNVSASAGIGVTLTNPLTITGTLALGGTTTFAGTHGWTCGTLTCSTPGATITLQQAIIYTTTTSVTMLGTNALKILMRSSDTVAPYVSAIWALDNTPATQSMVYVSATAIDSSSGMTIWSFGGVIDPSTQNWGAGSPQLTKSFTFVC